MARWTKSTRRQRGRVKAHEAKGDGRQARREEDRREIEEQLGDSMKSEFLLDGIEALHKVLLTEAGPGNYSRKELSRIRDSLEDFVNSANHYLETTL